jgi:hypothetical protein
MTDAVEIALIGAGAIVVPSLISFVAVVYSKRAAAKTEMIENRVVELDVKVDGRLTQLLTATNAQGRQDERDSNSITVIGKPRDPEGV